MLKKEIYVNGVIKIEMTGRAILESIKTNEYTMKECADPTERAMRYAADLLEYFELHNKNLTKEQYYRVTEALDAIKGALK